LSLDGFLAGLPEPKNAKFGRKLFQKGHSKRSFPQKGQNEGQTIEESSLRNKTIFRIF